MIPKKKKIAALHTLQKKRKRDVFKQNTKGENIKKVLADRNPPKTQFCKLSMWSMAW